MADSRSCTSDGSGGGSGDGGSGGCDDDYGNSIVFQKIIFKTTAQLSSKRERER